MARRAARALAVEASMDDLLAVLILLGFTLASLGLIEALGRLGRKGGR